MITVIKNGKAKRVCCPYCESLLEYEVNDLMMGGVVGKFYYYLPCPVCGEEISFGQETLEEGSVNCPGCGELLEFDLSEEEEEDET